MELPWLVVSKSAATFYAKISVRYLATKNDSGKCRTASARPTPSAGPR
jgi:hypothetical protein